ncbi:unnamed protein product [Allacma fusca]|uniref:Uncharacterized protein n=1 Tax=Allacma fusca TaxID=39272 RepID=A0A8J2NN36_9HEXA|nr:unnamed protein product [Allacma fusca]
MISDNFDRYNCDEFNLPSRLGILKNLDRFDAGFFALHGKQASVLDPRLRKATNFYFLSKKGENNGIA